VETLHQPEHEPKNPSQEIAEMLGREFGDEFGFDQQTLEEIAAEPFEAAFEIAYGYLMQAGQDADAVLAPWMEQ
jgi:hypothetical protein